jgi:formimidoylglutamate deiminase
MNRTFFFETAWLPAGWRRNVRVEVLDGVIRQIACGAAALPGDTRLALAVPGLPDVHSHAFQRAMAGLAERRGPSGTDDFWSWREVMYRFLGRIEPDDLEAIAAYAYADLLEAGFTCVGEFHYLHRSPRGELYQDPAELALRHAAAADATGIGLTLLPVFYESSQFGGTPPTAGQRRFITDLETFDRIVERVRTELHPSSGRNTGIAPHSLRAVTAPHLMALLTGHPQGPVHIHAAEQVKEVEDCLAFTGMRPIEWLLTHTGVTARWCVVHATHLTPEETAGLAHSGAVAGLCPVTEANLGDGIFPAPAYREAGGRWAIGTDSHIRLDAAGELRQLEYAQRLIRRERNVLARPEQPSTGASLLEEALRGGAQALALPVGAIATGHRADFLGLDAQHPDLAGRGPELTIDTWLFAVGRSLIRDVIAGGRTVVENGRHKDRDRIDPAYRRTLKRLLQAA